MSLTVSRVGASTKVTDDDARGGESNRARSTTRPREANRRAVLRGAAATGAAVAWGSGAIASAPGHGKGPGGSPGGGFPPKGITEYGPSVALGNGSVRTFTTQTPSGEPGTRKPSVTPASRGSFESATPRRRDWRSSSRWSPGSSSGGSTGRGRTRSRSRRRPRTADSTRPSTASATFGPRTPSP